MNSGVFLYYLRQEIGDKMNDKSLFNRYVFSSILLTISTVTISVAWGHWAYTLDVCPLYNCGCVLYGAQYSQGFSGGRAEYCGFLAFIQVPLLIFSLGMVFYSGYRAFIKAKKESLKKASRSNPLLQARQKPRKSRGENVMFDTQPSDGTLPPPSFKTRVALFVVSIVCAIILLTAAIMTTVGFYRSCKEYRRVLVQDLAVSGNAAQVVGTRMSCLAVFDFMDYLQPDRIDTEKPYHYLRKDRINTGVTLFISKTAFFMNFMNWLHVTFMYGRSLNWCRRKQ